jgi:hypothetical protein
MRRLPDSVFCCSQVEEKMVRIAVLERSRGFAGGGGVPVES